jgi:hypothetical protein
VFRTGSSRQPVDALMYDWHDVFRTDSSRQPVATISFICAALFVRTKVLFGRKVTSELWGYGIVKPARVLRLFLALCSHVTGPVVRTSPFQRAHQVRPASSLRCLVLVRKTEAGGRRGYRNRLYLWCYISVAMR